MTNISIIIPSLNGQHLLAECLPALIKQTYQDYVIFVIDNGSSDGTVEWLKEAYPHVYVIENHKNKGFAAAVNQGIRNSDSPYVVTLNNDVIVDETWLESLMQVAITEPRLGMCASKLVFWHDPTVINSSGISVDRAGIVWDRDGGMPDHPGLVDNQNVFGPCAGAALYKRAMLDEIGLFDEAYFAYFEDVDLAWRGRAHGWVCRYVDKAKGRHHHSSTSVVGSRFKDYQLGKNKVRLILKNYPFGVLWWYIPLMWFYDFTAIIYQFVVKGSLATLRGRFIGWCQAYAALRARPKYAMRYDVQHLSPISWPWSVWQRFRHLSDLKPISRWG